MKLWVVIAVVVFISAPITAQYGEDLETYGANDRAWLDHPSKEGYFAFIYREIFYIQGKVLIESGQNKTATQIWQEVRSRSEALIDMRYKP